MEGRTREQLEKMYKTEKTISVKTNELDYDTMTEILKGYDLTEEELLSKCFQVGLYTIANSIIESYSENPSAVAPINKLMEVDL